MKIERTLVAEEQDVHYRWYEREKNCKSKEKEITSLRKYKLIIII